MSTEDDDNKELAEEFEREYESPARRRWKRLKEVAPDLARFDKPGWNAGDPPSELSKSLFVALCACFADPTKREILRDLILDVLADDLSELLTRYLTEEPT